MSISIIDWLRHICKHLLRKHRHRVQALLYSCFPWPGTPKFLASWSSRKTKATDLQNQASETRQNLPPALATSRSRCTPTFLDHSVVVCGICLPTQTLWIVPTGANVVSIVGWSAKIGSRNPLVHVPRALTHHFLKSGHFDSFLHLRRSLLYQQQLTPQKKRVGK